MDKYESGFVKTPNTRIFCGVTYNVYNRFTLYEEVWSMPMIKVAEKYMVTNAGLKKVCKAMRIPTPYNGYWQKLYAGKHPRKTPLPDPDVNFEKEGLRPAYIEEKDEDGQTVRIQLKKSDVEKADARNRHILDIKRTREYRDRYNAEILHMRDALRAANNYDTACKLRKYAGALMDIGSVEEMDWVLAKADLYDPTVDITDDIFGKNVPLLSMK